MSTIRPRPPDVGSSFGWMVYLLEASVGLAVVAIGLLTVGWHVVAQLEIVARLVGHWNSLTASIPGWIAHHPSKLVVLVIGVTAYSWIESDVWDLRTVSDWSPRLWRYYLAIVFSYAMVSNLYVPSGPGTSISRGHIVVLLVSVITPPAIYLLERYWHVGIGGYRGREAARS